MVGLGLVMALAGTAIFLSRPTGRPATERDETDLSDLLIWSGVLFSLIYLGFLVACAAGFAWRPEPRYVAPVYPFVTALMVAGIERASRLLPASFGYRRLANAAGIFLCALWLQVPLRALPHGIQHYASQGAGEYSTSVWQESPFVQWLREHPLPGKICSNAPDAAYILAGIPAAPTPFHPENKAELARRELPAQTSYIVWFHGLPRTRLYDLRELRSRYQMQETAAFPHGSVYRHLGPGGPAISAVYRFWSVQLGRHFYTMQKAERDARIRRDDGTWAYEGPVFYAFAPDGEKPANAHPVYRFWSASLHAHFYTIDEAERDQLLVHPSGAWACEGVAFYAWSQPGEKDTLPVHRFWSARLGCHFFTISETEKAQLIDQFSDTWTYEGIAFYAYGP